MRESERLDGCVSFVFFGVVGGSSGGAGGLLCRDLSLALHSGDAFLAVVMIPVLSSLIRVQTDVTVPRSRRWISVKPTGF